MNEERNGRGAWGWKMVVWYIAWMVAIVLLGLAMVPPCISMISDKAGQSTTAGNGRQIVAALNLYAAEHGGQYPDAGPTEPKTSNQAFRILIREGVLDDERVFGAMSGRFIPDGNIGNAPEYAEALEPGENHWAMTEGVTDKSTPLMPLVFENAVSNAWPPKWNADAAGKQEPGRAWKDGKVIICFKDGSVQTFKLDSTKGTSAGLAKDADGKDTFTRAAESIEILDIER